MNIIEGINFPLDNFVNNEIWFFNIYQSPVIARPDKNRFPKGFLEKRDHGCEERIAEDQHF